MRNCFIFWQSEDWFWHPDPFLIGLTELTFFQKRTNKPHGIHRVMSRQRRCSQIPSSSAWAVATCQLLLVSALRFSSQITYALQSAHVSHVWQVLRVVTGKCLQKLMFVWKDGCFLLSHFIMHYGCMVCACTGSCFPCHPCTLSRFMKLYLSWPNQPHFRNLVLESRCNSNF